MNISYAIAYVSNENSNHSWSGKNQNSFVINTYVSSRFDSEHEAEFYLEKLFRDYHEITKKEEELNILHKTHTNSLRTRKTSPHSDEIILLCTDVETKKENFQLEHRISFDDLNFYNSDNHFQIHKQYNYDASAYRGYP